MNDIYIRLMDMPTTVRGHVVADSNGDYNIYLNSRQSIETLEYTILHEYEHINNDDFNSNSRVSKIEAKCKKNYYANKRKKQRQLISEII